MSPAICFNLDQSKILSSGIGLKESLYLVFLIFVILLTFSYQYAELEGILGDMDRARAIYELAVSQKQLDMPEVLWKAYIDFEIEQEEYNNVRNLYRRLLKRTQHVKV